MSKQVIQQGPTKKIKINQQNQQGQKQWIVIKKKTTPLTISISDHSKVNRYYSHKSIQKYIRYLLTQTCPNPMWLAIKRQSQIQHIYYIDIEIQDYLFEKMLQQNQLNFLSQKISLQNKAMFKQQKFNSYVWNSLFVYDQEAKLEDQEQLQQFVNSQRQRKVTKQIYEKYLKNTLTNQEMKENLYPDLRLPLYKQYHEVKKVEQEKQQEKDFIINKNLILVIDCQMVTTEKGFQLARCTIINYEEEIIFDEFFKPSNPILNYNTEYSGITKQILDPVQNCIKDTLYPFLDKIITEDTILIGHSLENDFNAMQFYHKKVVDTSVLFRRKNGSKMKLKNLADKILKRKIQSVTHDSKQDCLATLHLVQAKIQNQKSTQFDIQYHLLRDIVKTKHNIMIVDSDIDNLRKYNSIHFQKVQTNQNPIKIAEIIKKYSNKSQVCVPKITFSRFTKRENLDWEVYYAQINSGLEMMNNSIPEGSVFFLNFQINETVKIVTFNKQQSQRPKTRPFCSIFPKN